METYVFFASFRPREGSENLPDNIAPMEIVSQSVVINGQRRVSWIVSGIYNPQDIIVAGINDGCDNCDLRGHITNTGGSDQCYPHTNLTKSGWDPQGPGYNAFVVLKNEGPRGNAICPNFGRKFDPKDTQG